MSKPHDDIMYHRVTTFWKVVIVIAVAVGILTVPFILVLDGLWPIMTAIGCGIVIILAMSQINEADFMRKTGNSPRFPFNGK